jgi:hypothetical protein
MTKRDRKDLVYFLQMSNADEQTCLFAQTCFDLGAKAERQRLADELQKMPLNDTASSIAMWIRDQK